MYYKSKLYIPNNNKLRAELIYLYYDKPTSGYPSKNKIYKLLSCKYY
jgi:hypothetical protein